MNVPRKFTKKFWFVKFTEKNKTVESSVKKYESVAPCVLLNASHTDALKLNGDTAKSSSHRQVSHRHAVLQQIRSLPRDKERVSGQLGKRSDDFVSGSSYLKEVMRRFT